MRKDQKIILFVKSFPVPDNLVLICNFYARCAEAADDVIATPGAVKKAEAKDEAPRSKLRGILSAIAPQPYPPSLLRATARSLRHSSPQQAGEYPGEGE